MTKKVEANIDWVTATTLDGATGAAWMREWHKHKQKSKGKVENVNLHGFAGLRVEGLTWSIRDSDGRYMMVASGEAAGDLWGKVNTCHAKVTRVDLCVDCWLANPKPSMAREIYRVLSSPSWDASRLKYTLYQTSSTHEYARKGETLYCGSRASSQMGRLYDKGQETRMASAGEWWRYEVEFKAERAVQIARALSNPRGNSEVIRATVGEWFLERFVGPIFSPGEGQVIHTRTYIAKTTAQKRVAWLESQVRPTVAYLFSVGLGSEVVTALGMDHLLDAREIEKLNAEMGKRARIPI